tara:strand:- start:21 stop:395 length:375 start_codon:yes stop_codon:yes gene_type:complete
MELEKILAINGLPGLHRLKTSNNKGIFIEQLDSGKVRFVTNVSNRAVTLDNISIYTYSDSIPLKDIFDQMKTFEEESPLIKPTSSSQELKDFFRVILKDYDEDRVYVSDIKKLIKWYQLLKNEN